MTKIVQPSKERISALQLYMSLLIKERPDLITGEKLFNELLRDITIADETLK